MHELSIASAIVKQVELVAAEHGADGVDVVRLRLGRLSGVVEESLAFAWELVCADTVCAGSVLAVERVPCTAWCPACEVAVDLPGLGFRCPTCDASTTELLSGRELEISQVELSIPEVAR
ncbi:MAG: hydrogenase maturation nickel metallochaperone HypA [Actinomycetota bacterium]